MQVGFSHGACMHMYYVCMYFYCGHFGARERAGRGDPSLSPMRCGWGGLLRMILKREVEVRRREDYPSGKDRERGGER